MDEISKPIKRRHKPNKREESLVDNLDRLNLFKEFEAHFAPVVREDLAQNLTAEEIFNKYSPAAAGRAATIAMTEPDSGKALSAIKDILDRTHGKAIERKETTHRLAGLSDNELDAYLATKLKETAPRLIGKDINDEEEEGETDDND